MRGRYLIDEEDPIPVQYRQIHRLVGLVPEPLDKGTHGLPELTTRGSSEPRELGPQPVAAAGRGRDYQRLCFERRDDTVDGRAQQRNAPGDLREAQAPRLGLEYAQDFGGAGDGLNAGCLPIMLQRAPFPQRVRLALPHGISAFPPLSSNLSRYTGHLNRKRNKQSHDTVDANSLRC